MNLQKSALIHKGNLLIEGRKLKKYTVYLYSPLLLVLKVGANESLHKKHVIPVAQLVGVDVTQKKPKFGMSITFLKNKNAQEKLTFGCSSAQDRETWVEKISKVIAK